MTKRWKLKINSFNTLLVLITLMLVKAKWAAAAANPRDTNHSTAHQTHIYIGNDEIADYFFGSSVSNNSFILEDVRRCLDSFQLFTCMKMLLLSRINDIVSLMEDPNISQRDLLMPNGLFTFKVKNVSADSIPGETNDGLSLDEEIANKMRKIFCRRSLLVNFLPKMKIEIEPSATSEDNFLCFRYVIHRDESAKGDEVEGRKRKKGGMPMMMIVPPLIMLGLMPFTLASIKAMVMNAVMINMMALNGAIFMTIRNLVFGPRKGDNVKYVNYGYSKDRQTQSRRPVLIIHSPAAFVKQPPVYRHRRPPTPSAIKHHLSGLSDGSSYHEDQHYLIQGSDYGYKGGDRHDRIGEKRVEEHRRANVRVKRY